MGSNPGYLLKPFLLYPKNTYQESSIMANQQPHRRFKRETMSSRWMPGQKLAIVRKSDRLKSEGDFEGDRQLEEWSPADRFSDSTFYFSQLLCDSIFESYS